MRNTVIASLARCSAPPMIAPPPRSNDPCWRRAVIRFIDDGVPGALLRLSPLDAYVWGIAHDRSPRDGDPYLVAINWSLSVALGLNREVDHTTLNDGTIAMVGETLGGKRGHLLRLRREVSGSTRWIADRPGWGRMASRAASPRN
jgi:hypothetical protein